MPENMGFTERCIAKLQGMSIPDRMAQALNEYLIRHGRIAYDLDRNLFWVSPPHGSRQVAVWLMPVCLAVDEVETCPAL